MAKRQPRAASAPFHAFVSLSLFIPFLLAVVECAAAAAERPAAASLSSTRATIGEFCIPCHNDRLKTGGLTLESLDPNDVAGSAEAWERVVRKLRLGLMPPVGVRRPDRSTSDNLIASLEGALDAAAARHPSAGRPLLHRLNRTEYANAIRDLLGLQLDVASLLPPDDAAFGFDNVADALGNSPALTQAYLAAARKISAVAVGDPAIGTGSVIYSVRQDLSQDQHLEDLPLGTVGGLRVQHTFPTDGAYEFQVRLFRTNLSAMRGIEDKHQIELTLDGDRLLLATVGGDEDLLALQKNPTATSDEIELTRLRVRIVVKAGQHDVAAAFLEGTPALLKTNRLQRFLRDFNPYDAEGTPHVQSVTIVGPFTTTVASEGPVPRLFVCSPKVAAAERTCAQRILSLLARRAYRRPPSMAEIENLLAFYDRGRAEGSFRSGIELALRRLLASPSFLFREERDVKGAALQTPYRLRDFELASRLSFLLWSSIPDEELLKVAAAGTLKRPLVLERQVRRMLADSRSSALVMNFAGQWLQLRNLRGIVPNSDLFPDFDDNLRQAFKREAELYFGSIVSEDRNVLDLMTADYTFLNERLARHYGIPNVFGSGFRRVHVADEARRGLLGKGAVLLVTSHANNTSPVLRGKWILENVLGAPPLPPPPDVPALPENEAGTAPRTMREQMERHRSNPVCAACHKGMDSIGFALENFDVVGAWRRTTDGGVPLNAADTLGNGKKVDGVVELRQALLDRPDVFVQTLTEKLLVYAVGRGLTYRDMPAVRRIVRAAQRHDFRFSSLVIGIVSSMPFQMRDSAEWDGQERRAGREGQDGQERRDGRGSNN
jgi:hypothetical protein